MRLITIIVLVGLFSCHANLLRLVHEHLVTSPMADAGPQEPAKSVRGVRVQLITPEQVQRVAQRYQEGRTVYELAAELSCHRTTISKTLKQQGITLRRVKPTDSQIDVMVHLYGNGLSLATIGRQLGFDGMTVRKYLLERGVRMRDAQGRAR